MTGDKSTPRATDDLETAERKSKTIDERVPEREAIDPVEEDIELPGAIMRSGPMTDEPGPGELALEKEEKAARTHIVRG
jgi:hypothetical protein